MNRAQRMTKQANRGSTKSKRPWMCPVEGPTSMTVVWVVQTEHSESLKIKEGAKWGLGSQREWIWEVRGRSMCRDVI